VKKKKDARITHQNFGIIWGILVYSKNKKPCKSRLCRAFVRYDDLKSDPAGIRTQDPYIKSVMLYQLSYGIFKKAEGNFWEGKNTAKYADLKFSN
jgi:hypothetical protein